MKAEHAELVVIGAGPGGYAAAFRAADLGKKVALVERHASLGGVCLNVGCIPSKALLHTAKVIDDAAGLRELGVRFAEPSIDVDRLRSWKDGVVQKLTSGLDALTRKRRVQRIRGTAELVSPRELRVSGEEGERRVVFEQAILAVGSRPIRLSGLPWEDSRVMDSTDALALPELPRQLLLIGGGIIGLEMACVYQALGVQVTIVEAREQLLPGVDEDLVRPLANRLARRCESIRLLTRVERVESRREGLRVWFHGGAGPDRFDRILVAVGRRPNTDRLGASRVGIETDQQGFIRVDERFRTTFPNIFAIGDAIGAPFLAHKATHEGTVAAEIAAGHDGSFDAHAIPCVAYTDPEVAWVGVTENEAKSQGIDFGKGVFPWSASGRALGMNRSEGMTKVLFEKAQRRLIGMGAVGPHAGDLVAEAALAMETGCDAADLALTVHAHPTLSETVSSAAQVFEGTVLDLYAPLSGGGKSRRGASQSRLDKPGQPRAYARDDFRE